MSPTSAVQLLKGSAGFVAPNTVQVALAVLVKVNSKAPFASRVGVVSVIVRTGVTVMLSARKMVP